MALRTVFAVVLLAWVGMSPAAAQDESPTRPLFRGLFGGAMPLPSREHVLDLSGSIFGGKVETDNNDPESVPDATFRGGSASLVYQRGWRGGASVNAFASGGTSYSEELKDIERSPWVTRWSAGGGGSYNRRVGRRTSFSTNGNVVYSPYYGLGVASFGSVPGVGGGFGVGPAGIENIPGLDYTVARQASIATSGTAQLSHGLSRRSTLDSYYSGSFVTFFDESPDAQYGDYQVHTLGTRYRHEINRYVSARAGYAYSRAIYDLDGVESEGYHTIDAGVDGGYGREYQIARRTTFSFNTNSNVFVGDRLGDDGTSGPSASLFLGGSAGLAHRWGRTWEARADYNRGAGYVQGFREPVLSNSATARVGGVPFRRLDFSARVTYVVGEVGFGDAENDFDTTTANAQLRWAITRNIAAFGQYFYYNYRFDAGVLLPGGIDPNLDRRGWSVGLTAWLPLL